MATIKEKEKYKNSAAYEYFMITVGTIISAAGIYLFKIPRNLIMGGVTGISVALSLVLPSGFPISTAWIVMILNLLLLAVGFIFLGKDFGIKTVYTSLLSSAIGVVLDYVALPLPLTDNLLLEAIFAIALPGIGTAIMFYHGASSGGTDIIALIVKKYTGLESGTALMYVDMVIMLAAFTGGMELGLMSMLGLFTKTLIVDRFIDKMNNSKYFLVVTTMPEEIGQMINQKFGRGATVWQAEGMYTKTEKYIILVVMSPKESAFMKKAIKRIDEHAFLIVENSSDIMGRGFKSI